MRSLAMLVLICALLVADPTAAQERAVARAPVVEVGSFVRIEYTRYFARRRELVDSADAGRANRWRKDEIRGRVEELSETHVRLRAHDRTFSVRRWQIDRAWLYVHTEDSEHAGESMTEWGLGGILTAGIGGGLLAAATCTDDPEDYCGLAIVVIMMGVTGIGIVAGVVDMMNDADQDFVEVAL